MPGPKRSEVRFKEIEDGKLTMPKEPRTLYVLTGTGFDSATGTVQDPYLRWVIYVPFATPQSTGLSTKAKRWRALADVARHRGRPHYDQPAEEKISRLLPRKDDGNLAQPIRLFNEFS